MTIYIRWNEGRCIPGCLLRFVYYRFTLPYIAWLDQCATDMTTLSLFHHSCLPDPDKKCFVRLILCMIFCQLLLKLVYVACFTTVDPFCHLLFAMNIEHHTPQYKITEEQVKSTLLLCYALYRANINQRNFARYTMAIVKGAVVTCLIRLDCSSNNRARVYFTF